MGYRANVLFIDNANQPIYFYTHWEGEKLWYILQSALARGQDRWHDSPYLARIIFSEMIKEDIDNTTGFGISTTLIDNEFPILKVDSIHQLIEVNDYIFTFNEYLHLNFDPRQEIEQ
jgi:hypothetical protein